MTATLTAPACPIAPEGCVIVPYREQGSDGVWLWRLTLARKRRVKHEGYPTRHLTVDLGDVSWYRDRWVGHAENGPACSPEYTESAEAVAWLLAREEEQS